MTIRRIEAVFILYTLNSLAAAEPERTTTDLDDATESSLTAYILERARLNGIDVSFLEHAFRTNTKLESELDDMYQRWLNAADPGKYWLRSGTNGWLWVSSVSVDAFFGARDNVVIVDDDE